VCGNRNDNQDYSKNPQPDHDGNKDAVANLPTEANLQEGVQGDREHENSTHRVTDLKPNSLQETSRVVGMDGVLVDPSQTDNESQSLDEISECEVVHENDILIVSNVAFVVLFPEDETIGEKTQETECGNERNHRQRGNGDETASLQ
jgi:hypothetical protein